LLLVKHYPQQVKVFDTSKKPRSSTGNKITNLYRKNICGYITRRITREFLSDHF
jgi:ribosomal protein S17E